MFVNRWKNFSNLSREVSYLVRRVSKIVKINSEDQNLYKQTLKSLNQKVKKLEHLMWTQGRLPIQYGNEIEKEKHAIFNHMELKEVDDEHLFAVDVDTFHMLASQWTHFNGIQTKKLEGNKNCRSLINLIQVLQEMIKEYGDLTLNKKKLVGRLQFALKVCLKRFIALARPIGFKNSTYVDLLSQSEFVFASLEQKQALAYNKKGIYLKKNIQSLLSGPFQKELNVFFKQANLRNCALPQAVILQDLCWDFLQAAEQLTEGDYVLIPLGTLNHFVMAQLDVAIVFGSKTYSWTLYNTGEDCEIYHMIKLIDQQEFVSPLKIGGIQPQALSYDFWKEVLNCVLKGTSIQSLYQIQQRYLIDLGQGYRLKSAQDFIFPIPKFGVCTYSAPEMVVFHHLSEEEVEYFQKNKLHFLIKKQSKVVQERFKFLNQLSYPGLKLARHRFKQSRRLLQISHRFLFRFSNNIDQSYNFKKKYFH